MSVTAAPAPNATVPQASAALTKFGFVEVVVQRARQLRGGARPRIDATGHKELRVALLEVAAGVIAWEILGGGA